MLPRPWLHFAKAWCKNLRRHWQIHCALECLTLPLGMPSVFPDLRLPTLWAFQALDFPDRRLLKSLMVVTLSRVLCAWRSFLGFSVCAPLEVTGHTSRFQNRNMSLPWQEPWSHIAHMSRYVCVCHICMYVCKGMCIYTHLCTWTLGFSDLRLIRP